MNLIELSQIQRYFGAGESRVQVLDDINLTIAEGEFVAIVGPSGSGKSTLMNILGCLDLPNAGSYRFMGRETSTLSPDELAALRRRFFGFIFQRYYLMPGLKAWENVALPALYDNMPLTDRKTRAQALLADLGLGEKLNNRPSELSGGQQQRVSIARALMNGGKIILADEPTGALDSKSGSTVMVTLVQLNQQGHTVIMVTHDVNIAARADRIIEIRDGQIVSDRMQDHGTEKSGPSPAEQSVQKPLESPSSSVKKHRWTSFFSFSQLREALRMSVQSIWSHKLRSFLTMLGIIIGICAVVTVVAIGQGSQQQILKQLSNLGSNTLQIFPGSGWGDIQGPYQSSMSIQDNQVLAQQPYVVYSSPVQAISGTAIYRNEQRSASIYGTLANYPEIRALTPIMGRFFTPEEDAHIAQVAVINDNFYNEVFKKKHINPIGQIILYNNVPLRIIGVVKQNGSSFTQDGGSSSLGIYTPISTIMTRIIGNQRIQVIIVKIKDNYSVAAAEQNITQLLTLSHGRKDFFIWNANSFRDQITRITSALTLLVSSIAFIALVVGGIGVMNIMLVSVSERTQEIGIKIAIGARPRNILQQFLVESVILCLIGGMLGVLVSLGIIFIFNAVVTQFQMIFNVGSFVAAVLVSSITGIIFGLMPARRAARLTPMQAMLQNE